MCPHTEASSEVENELCEERGIVCNTEATSEVENEGISHPPSKTYHNSLFSPGDLTLARVI